MKELFYNRNLRNAVKALQGLLAGLLVFCLLTVQYWAGVNGAKDLGRSFERTDVFMAAVEKIVRAKIGYLQNLELFERDGAYDENRAIDIRQYSSGISDEANLNVNTAYYIRDLLLFAESGAPAMEKRIRSLLEKGRTETEAGTILAEEYMELETVFPVSGSTLADYSRLSANPAATLLDYYRSLSETAMDVAARYAQYKADAEQEECENRPEAPSNVRYYAENTNTKQRYTNLGVQSLSAAKTAVTRSGNFVFLFEGERRFNIMVANTENVLNDEASRYFMNNRFVGTSEKILIAVDPEYPIGDALRTAWENNRDMKPYAILLYVLAAAAAMILPLLLFLSVMMTGKTQTGEPGKLALFDLIPTEIAAGLMLIAGITWWMLGQFIRGRGTHSARFIITVTAFFSAVEYIIMLLALLSFVRRLRAHTLWKNSVSNAVVLGARQVYSARERTQRMLLAYGAFFILNFVFLRLMGLPGIFMAIVMDAAVLLYLMRDSVGNQNVREGLRQISQGKLDYRIRTDVLTGESREMGEAVNEMGEGLEKAVDSMLKNERLRAELITNVSHDLKTPLTSIISYVDLLKKEDLKNEKAVGYVNILDQKAQRLRQLTEDLLEVSKISSGNVELDLVKMRLQPFIRQALGEFEDRLEEKDLKIRTVLPRERVEVLVDGKQLFRVFENLLGNIVKYAKEGSEVLVQLQAYEDGNGAWAQILFENISAVPIHATGDELRERFARGDASRRTEGSGLGLSIAGSLTELMGGTFDVQVDGDVFRAVLRFPECRE